MMVIVPFLHSLFSFSYTRTRGLCPSAPILFGRRVPPEAKLAAKAEDGLARMNRDFLSGRGLGKRIGERSLGATDGPSGCQMC